MRGIVMFIASCNSYCFTRYNFDVILSCWLMFHWMPLYCLVSSITELTYSFPACIVACLFLSVLVVYVCIISQLSIPRVIFLELSCSFVNEWCPSWFSMSWEEGRSLRGANSQYVTPTLMLILHDSIIDCKKGMTRLNKLWAHGHHIIQIYQCIV